MSGNVTAGQRGRWDPRSWAIWESLGRLFFAVFPWWPQIALVAAVFLLMVSMFGNPLSRETYGRILVDTPEVYTRERLVNDRFLQEAWLTRQLDPSGGIQASEQVLTVAQAIGVAMRAAREKPSGESKPVDSGKGTDDAGKGAGADGRGPRLSTRAKLMEELDYRELVRNLAIENQLDDRHDLNGNSLYKLKFDASILPGANTQASAEIQVRLLEPTFVQNAEARAPNAERKDSARERRAKSGSAIRAVSAVDPKSGKEAWARYYQQWIQSLDQRLNQTHRELRLVYDRSEFGHNDYAVLIAFLLRHWNLELNSLPPCHAGMLDSRTAILALNAKEHAKRKECIQRIAYKSTEKLWATEVGAVDQSGEKYVIYGPREPGSKPLTDSQRAGQVKLALEHRLNAFFAPKTLRLVLGVAVPEEAFVYNPTLYNIPALANLARLTFYAMLPPVPDDSRRDAVFTVAPKVFELHAINPRIAKQATLDGLASDVDFPRVRLEDFKPVSFARPEDLRLLQDTKALIEEDGVELSIGDFKEVADGLGVYRATVHAGLHNFIRFATEHNVAFTYAVTPKESAETVSSIVSHNSQLSGQASGAEDKSSAAVQARRELLSKAIERRPTVVGFTGNPPKEAKDTKAEFGWLIGPRRSGVDGRPLSYTQVPSQYSLSALISIPAWWNSMRLQVTTRWVDADGRRMHGESAPIEMLVELPPDFEALETLLLGIDQLGPELMDARLDPILLTACQPGSILIPGRRLWRSTKVSLGYQLADSISVLPNMKGIIAQFDAVQNHMTVDELHQHEAEPKSPRRVLRTVRLWTSQGSLTLPMPASIGVPEGTDAKCKEKPDPKQVAQGEGKK